MSGWSPAVRSGHEALERGGGKILGAVMNKLKESAFGEYYYRYYGYYSEESKGGGSTKGKPTGTVTGGKVVGGPPSHEVSGR